MLGSDARGIYSYWWAADSFNQCLYSDELRSFAIEDISNCKVLYGSSKICLVPRDLPYVIKMPITHLFDDSGRVFKKAQTNFIQRENVLFKKFSKQSCAANHILLSNDFIGHYNSIPVYIQKKVIPFEDWIPNEYESSEIMKAGTIRLETHTKDFDPMWIAQCIRTYGENETRKFLELCKNSDMVVDMAENNYGIGYDNKPYIYDYASYYEDLIWREI